MQHCRSGRGRTNRLGAAALLLVACLGGVGAAFAAPHGVVGTFTADEDGGLWSVSVDPVTGRLGDPVVIVRDPQWRSLRKVAARLDAEGRRSVAATAPVERRPNLVIVEIGAPARDARPEADGDAGTDDRRPDAPRIHTHTIPGTPDEIRATREGFLVGGGSGFVVHALLDRDAARRCAVAPPCYVSWTMRTGLEPPGSAPEDIMVRPDGRSAWITLQKDSKDGAHRGHRLIRLGLPDLDLLGDIHLERSLPEHHPALSPRDHGPSPEVVREDDATGTLVVTLDNYGAVLLADLDAALEGRLEGAVRLGTGADGAFGSAYPDRLLIVDRPGGAVALVANAGPDGGAAVVDLRTRRIVATPKCRPGLESPTPVGDGSLVVAASAGKVKTRSDTGASKSFEPAPEIIVFDLADPAHASAHVFPRPHPVVWVTRASDAAGDLVVAVERRADAAQDDLTLLRVARGAEGAPVVEALATVPAPGRIQRATVMPSRPAAGDQ